MGSSTMLDIISSMLISGFLLMTALHMDEQSVNNTYYSETNLTVQQNMTSLVENLEYDFRKMGYCADPNVQPESYMYVVKGNSGYIWFLADLDNMGVLDTVKYFLGTDPIPGCANQHVRMLYRQVNSNPPFGANLGVAEFSLRYMDGFGQQLPIPFTAPSQVQMVEITLKVEPTAAYGDTSYTQNFALWRQTRLISRNLHNR
ncbi:MAG: hypothetical protein M1378_11620 [Bacteroidetes bacterium]|nr:hypothetical protein [Bacteroidota bacterium]